MRVIRYRSALGDRSLQAQELLLGRRREIGNGLSQVPMAVIHALVCSPVNFPRSSYS
jgi:hypothetical protein